MSLWAWASEVWAKPVVERACLDLQDRAGQSVVLLLWGAWSATHRRPVDCEIADHATKLVRPIETDLLRPLRNVRRSLAQSMPGLDDQARKDAHAQVRALELTLERTLLEALEQQTTGQRSEPATDAAGSVQMLMETWSGEPLDDNRRALAQALAEALA